MHFLRALTVLTLIAFYGSAEAKQTNTALIVVDAQKKFVSDATPYFDTRAVLSRISSLIDQAHKNGDLVIATFEARDDGQYAYPNELTAALSRGALSYIKSYFAASRHTDFVAVLRKRKVSRVILTGAETDVCVELTALGLRELGFDVWVVTDAVLSSTPRVEDALKRMQLANVRLIETKDVLEASSAPVAEHRPERRLIIDPKERLAIVVSPPKPNSSDCQAEQKLETLSHLLMFASWLDLPVYVAGTDDLLALRNQLVSAMSEKARRAVAGHRWRLIHEFKPGTYRAIVFAGAVSVRNESVHSMQEFVVSDTIVGQADAHRAGAIPTSYKSFYRELLGSVNVDDWADEQWADRSTMFDEVLPDPDELPRLKFAANEYHRCSTH